MVGFCVKALWNSLCVFMQNELNKNETAFTFMENIIKQFMLYKSV